jgi:transglutaminase-like putative cysteine protease
MNTVPSTELAVTPCGTGTRGLRVRHVTRYSYDRPVERSFHRLHLTPFDDRRQRLLEHVIRVTPDVVSNSFEDAFGNFTTSFEIEKPFTEVVVTSESRVELLDVDPFEFAKHPGLRPKFPVAWLSGERIMLAPYLTPPELPETHIRSLYDYAASFADRNSGDLMETLFDINLTLFREYSYAPGQTTLTTTPFDVYESRTGVCQDFAGLFICLTRLLGVPARYVCGYLYTGNHGSSRAQSDATHAWVQVYIPNIGWKGFDPTNGVLPSTDHVRLACGRSWSDTAPTAGTLYTSAVESMMTDVEVSEDAVAAA